MKIKLKLGLVILGMIATVIGVLGGISYYMTRCQLTDQIETNMLTVARMKAAELDRRFEFFSLEEDEKAIVKDLVAEMAQVRVGEMGYGLILDANGKMKVHPDRNLIGKSLMGILPEGARLFNEIKGNRAGHIARYSYKGEAKLLCGVHIPAIDWYLVVSLKAEEVYAPLTKQLTLMVALAGISLGLGLCVNWYLGNNFTTPLLKTMSLMERAANGDVSGRLNFQRNDEFGDMGKSVDLLVDKLERKTIKALRKIAQGDISFNIKTANDKDMIGSELKAMLEGLNELVYSVQNLGGQISMGSSQVANTSQTLSSGATEQASSLDQVYSSMQQIGEQIEHNAENATQASSLAGETKLAAEKGNSSMASMMGAMEEINASSANISKIIKVIEEIAFQTNLLALNAAVEAARAGQHGKGFAVVAEEVRNLAGRSAKAAQETTALIEGSVGKAKNGMQIAGETASALGEIMDSATKVTDLVNDIASASRQQAAGVSQINQGLGQIDLVTQQNTASAKEAASVAEELSTQADELLSRLNRFKLLDQGPQDSGLLQLTQ